jgi:hypothetical protein
MSRPWKDLREAVRLYRLGTLTIAEIARLQEPPVSRQAMWRALKRRGVLKEGNAFPGPDCENC